MLWIALDLITQLDAEQAPANHAVREFA